MLRTHVATTPRRFGRVCAKPQASADTSSVRPLLRRRHYAHCERQSVSSKIATLLPNILYSPFRAPDPRGDTMNTRRRLGLAVTIAAVFVLTASLAAQTPYIPYFGKNSPRYDHFEWWTYETDHFVIYYYPDIEPHLERMAGYAESAYQHVSSELKYDLAHKVPLILFQTSSEFQQQNVVPGAAQEGVGAFAEPTR